MKKNLVGVMFFESTYFTMALVRKEESGILQEILCPLLDTSNLYYQKKVTSLAEVWRSRTHILKNLVLEPEEWL